MAGKMDHKAIKTAMLYELRMLLSAGDKQTSTKEELLRLLDKIALAKSQE